MKPEEPTVASAVAYFVDMAKGKATPLRSKGQNGLGAVRQPSTNHVIPDVKLVMPTAQAIAQAKDSISRTKAIRGQKRSAGQGNSKNKKKKTGHYQMPGLD